MPPAAQLLSMHTCPMVTAIVPHVGGPVIAPTSTAMIGVLPAVTQTFVAVCVGPPDQIIKGSSTVMIQGKPAVRMGDTSAHGGAIVMGQPTVMIGG